MLRHSRHKGCVASHFVKTKNSLCLKIFMDFILLRPTIRPNARTVAISHQLTSA